MDRRSLIASIPVILLGTNAEAQALFSSQSPFGPQHPPPACDRPTECRFTPGATTSTLVSCAPMTVDRAGNVTLLPPCNATTTIWTCVVCGKSWDESS
jgi:hypothetical protein